MLKNIASKLILIFIFLSYSQLLFGGAKHCRLSDKIVKRYCKEFTKPRGLYVSSFGGAMMHDIKKVILGFVSFDALTVDEARVLYVDMMEEFLHRINENEKIRPYLHNHPFTIDNYDLMIGFEDSKRTHRSDGHVALILIGKNQELIFCGYGNREKKFYDIHREPYEEALKIVKAQREECAKPAT